MPLNTLYLLRDIQQMDGRNIENVYFFNHSSGDGVSTDLALDFEGAWLPTILSLQSAALQHVGIAVYNMGDLGDFATLPLASNGTYGGDDPLPSFNAIGYSFKLNTRAVRPGSKRIAGIPEVVTTKNEITNPLYLERVENLRLLFAANLVGASDTWTPVVVKRVKTLVVGTVPPQYTYALPTTDAELVTGGIVQVLDSVNITSQVSRK